MRMLVSSISLLILSAAPAAARDGAWYVGGDFGAMIVEGGPFDVGANPDSVELDHDIGITGAAFIGYDIGSFRTEGELGYQSAGLKEFSTRHPLHNSSGTLHPVGTHPGEGRTSALSFMINGMFDFGDEDGLSAFVGGGIGGARVSFDRSRAEVNGGVFLDDSDTRFAWQVVAGVRHSVQRNVDLHLRYRFFNVTSLEPEPIAGGQQFRGGVRSHSLLAGITFNFGKPN